MIFFSFLVTASIAIPLLPLLTCASLFIFLSSREALFVNKCLLRYSQRFIARWAINMTGLHSHKNGVYCWDNSRLSYHTGTRARANNRKKTSWWINGCNNSRSNWMTYKVVKPRQTIRESWLNHFKLLAKRKITLIGRRKTQVKGRDDFWKARPKLLKRSRRILAAPAFFFYLSSIGWLTTPSFFSFWNLFFQQPITHILRERKEWKIK